MNFEFLFARLIVRVREMVTNGELTERRLAKIVGISQPHIHNILKGIRPLTPELSDRLLRGVHLSVTDLIAGADEDGRVPLIDGAIGPAIPYPMERYSRTYAVPKDLRAGLMRPLIFRLARDPEMEPEIAENDFILVDRSPQERRVPRTGTPYLVTVGGCGAVRYIRRRGFELYLANWQTRDRPDLWRNAGLDGHDILEIVRGRIVWIARQMETPPGPADPAGTAIRPHGGTGCQSGAGDGSGGYGAPSGRPDPPRALRGVHQASEHRHDPDRDGADAGDLRPGDVP